MNKLNLLLISFVLFSLGCATAPGKSSGQAKAYKEAKYSVSLRQGHKINKRACVVNVKSNKLSELVSVANSCLVQKQWKKLKAVSNTLAKKHSQSPWGAYFLSLVAEKEKNYEASYWYLDLARKKAPKLGLIYYQMARLNWLEGKKQSAVENFEQSIRLKAYVADSHLFLGEIYLRDQSYSKATQHLRQVLNAEPRNAKALYALSKVYLAKKDIQAAVFQIEKLVKTYPKNIIYRVELAHLYEVYEKDYQQALVHYQVARRINRRHIVGNITVAKKVVELREKLNPVVASNLTRVPAKEKAKGVGK